MQIPLNAQVECTDGFCGHSKYVLINPIINQVISLVVEEDLSPNKEYIIPVEFVTETIANIIQLRCSKAELEKMDLLKETKFIGKKVVNRNLEYVGGMIGMGAYYYLPYVTPVTTTKIPVEELQIPHGELAINRGTRVEATDGYIGKVDEFVVNPKRNRITHLVMREGHLWGRKM